MSSSIQEIQVEPPVRLSNQEWQKFHQPDRKSIAQREKPVYEQLRQSFEKEIYSSSFDPVIRGAFRHW
jgi:hypothetical protein